MKQINDFTLINFEEYTINAIEKLRKISKYLHSYGLTPWTLRISLPRVSIDFIDKIIDYLTGIVKKWYLVSIGAIDLRHLDEDLLESIVSSGFYVSLHGIYVDPLELSVKASKLIHHVADIDPVYATRIAIAYHKEPLETPYFPDSTSSGKEGAGIAFLYPKYIVSRIEKGLDNAFKDLETEISNVIKLLEDRVPRLIIDYSLSPWMDESVVKLLSLMGFELGSPGFNYGVWILNDRISRMAEKLGYAGGFNEVMLPYAEDSLLIDAGRKGLLRARDLLLYSSTCVAGPDMIVVPMDRERLAGFILDVYALWLVKKRPLANRIIPVDGKPGDRVSLGKFGDVYVIDY